ncbi:MAG: C69 family dipeptidase [candidate division KSB1 bacterium]|nr:C69 family dipeptidase [candidate division KSB1 bacterium]MDZ7295091.1 C69 family dipeptidase [candidate division KSB1 bacterium]MDZ7393962.1 C69 family dipeptidase [candidate division KSB1 bacterium]MDZ7414209.1 C69 family dipeptidase [candidate division KSB1 bacterium]
MVRQLVIVLLILVAAGLVLGQSVRGLDCFSIVVGRNASADGSVLVAHNEDDGGRQLVSIYKVPRLQHGPEEKLILSPGAELPQAEETFGYLWLEMRGMEFADCFLNEWGVVVASDACLSREDRGELTGGGIGYWLRHVVAQRARTAREAVKLAGALVEQFGYSSSGRTYVIADTQEGWLLAAVHGKHWVAQRVPDDMVAVIPNYYTITAVDLADTLNFLGSPDIVAYAQQRGWYQPERDGPFDFAKAYSKPSTYVHPSNVQRMWRGVSLLSGRRYALDDRFPFAFRPKEKVTVRHLMAILRDHFEGTVLDKSQGYKRGSPHRTGDHTICAPSTQFGFVAQLRSWLPVSMGAVLFVAPRRPDVQAFVPWYAGVESVPEGYAVGDYQTALREHSSVPRREGLTVQNNAFMAFETLADKVDADFARHLPLVRKLWDPVEEDIFRVQEAFERECLAVWKESPATGQKMLTQTTSALALKVWKLTRGLLEQME